jgi:hypothetical protein
LSWRRVIDHIAWGTINSFLIVSFGQSRLSLMYSAAPSKLLLLVLFRSMKDTLLVGSDSFSYFTGTCISILSVLQYCLDWQLIIVLIGS